MTLELGKSKLGRVFERGPQRASRLRAGGSRGRPVVLRRRFGATAGLYVPLVRQRPVDRRARTRSTSWSTATALHRRRPAAGRDPLGAGRGCGRPLPEGGRATRYAASSSAQELERERLARELHDETGQALDVHLMGLRTSRASRTGTPARRRPAAGAHVTTLQDVRRLAVELRPKALDDFGLSRRSNGWSRLGGADRDRQSTRRPASATRRIDRRVETAIFRIVQEALTNVVKHAQASRAASFSREGVRGLVAVFEDDGRGFARERERDGLGLRWMRERVELLDGRL